MRAMRAPALPRTRVARLVRLVAGLGLLLGPGCGAPPVSFEFAHGSEPGAATFVAVTANPAVIRAVRAELDKPLAQRTLHINGPIARGDGGHNAPWSWQFTKGKWVLTDFSMEECNGRPADVEQNLDEWLDGVGRYCPWASRVSREL